MESTNAAPLYTGSNPIFTNIRLVSYDNDVMGGSLSTVSDLTSNASTQTLNFRDTFTLSLGTKKVAVVANIPTSLPASFN